MKEVSLITITHDPDGKNLNLFLKLRNKIPTFYRNMYIVLSENTHEILKNELEIANFKINIKPKNGIAEARRNVLSYAINSGDKFYHYCDFDRLLTWINSYPEELNATLNGLPKYDYTIIGRTERAIKTHPIEWIETEKIANKIFSLEFGKNLDITSGSCGLSLNAARYIENYSSAEMTDAEWPMIIHRIANLSVGYTTVEGLEYLEDINSSNCELNEAEEWLKRIKLCSIIGESAIKTGR